jgi:hypothetical protein
MATRTFTIAKDGSVMAGYDSGNFNDAHLPVGYNGTYTWRPLLRFNLDFSGVVAITDAKLYLRTVLYHTGRGSSAYVRARRITSSWSGTGGSENTWSSSASPKWSTQPSDTTTDQSPATAVPSSYDVWFTIDVTAIVQSWFGGSANYGLKLYAVNSSGTVQEGSDVYRSEYYSSLSSYDPYIVITYTTNRAPDAPTGLSPSGGALTLLAPTLSFSWSDPDGDNISSYDIQVSTDSTFGTITHWNASGLTSGINTTTKTVSVGYGGSALSRGATYYWRARATDPSGATGAWSSTASFKVNSLPTVSLTEPSATGRLAKLTYTAGSGWTSPRMVVAWSFSDPDGSAQASYRVLVQNDSSGAPGSTLYDSGQTAGTASTITVPANLAEGSYYHVTVTAWDNMGESSSSGPFRVRARWGLSQHQKDLGSAPKTWNVSTLLTTTGSTSAVVVEYNSADDSAGTGLGAWQASLADVPLKRWVRYRVWLLAWGASPATSPSLDKLVISYNTQVLQPDHWTASYSPVMALDDGARVYGTQSLRLAGDGGGWRWAAQTIAVEPNTWYTLSAFMKTASLSGMGATVEIKTASDQWLAGFPYVTGTTDWTRYSTAWYSGSMTSVQVRCLINATSGYAWFDAIQLEASTIVTPWRPGFVGEAVVVDAGGLMVDGSAGGTLRLRGAAGGTRDVVELGANGLRFGGDTEVYSSAPGRLVITKGGADAAEIFFPAEVNDPGRIIHDEDNNVAGLLLSPSDDRGSSDYVAIGSHPAGTWSEAVRIRTDGTFEWSGTALERDVNLYRAAANILRTDDTFEVGNYPNLPSVRIAADVNYNGSIELRGTTPFVDFANDSSVDYDARLRLTGDDTLSVEGADLIAASTAILGSRVGRALSKTTQSLSNNTQTKLTGWSSLWTGLGTTYNSTNSSIVVSRAGLYLIFLEVDLPARTDYRRVILEFAVAANDGDPTTVATTDEWTISPDEGTGFSHARHYKAVWIRALNANDAVAFHVNQTNTAAVAVTMDSARAGVVGLAL